jgi:hypothetical protein
MRRLTPELGRLAAARPEAVRRTAALVGDDDRRALLAAIMAGECEITRPRPTVPSARPGSGLRARCRRKPWLTARVIAAAGAVAALAAGALTAADVTGAFGSGNAEQIQTAAYITRVEHVLATQAQEGLVSYSRTVLPPGTAVEPSSVYNWKNIGPTPGTPSPRSPFTDNVMVTWEYQDSEVDVASTTTGQPVYAEQITATQITATGRVLTAVVVSYRNATWWRATQTLPPGAPVPPGVRLPPPGCRRGSPPASNKGQPVVSNGWPAYIRQALSCGVYHQDGRQRVDGIDAVKLTRNWGRLVMWIDPATYLPLRATQARGGVGPTDFRWFPVTAASLAHLKVSVPAGFRQVQPPPGW